MRVLVTGASGQLGRKVVEVLAQAGHEVRGLAHGKPRPGQDAGEITDPESLRPFFAAPAPEAVVHAAALRDPDLCEQDPYLAKKVNIEGTKNVLELADGAGARLLFISSDYVFDGKTPPYREESRVNPVNYYGRTKVEGEEAVLKDRAKGHAVLRLPLLYNQDDPKRPSFLKKILDALRAGQPVKLDHRRPRHPTLVDDAARVIRLILEEKLAGVFHFGGAERMTNYEAARRVGEILSLPAGHVAPDREAATRAPRPPDPRLEWPKLLRTGLAPAPTPFAKAVWGFWRRLRQAEG